MIQIFLGILFTFGLVSIVFMQIYILSVQVKIQSRGYALYMTRKYHLELELKITHG